MRGRSIGSAIAVIVVGLIAAVGCKSEVEPGATTAVSHGEIPGQHSPSDLDPLTAQRFVDHVRVGSDVDPAGQVPQHLVANTFTSDVPIYVSLEVTDAPAGSLVEVALFDAASTEEVWSEQRTVDNDTPTMSFRIKDRLPLGRYRAQVMIGDETVARREFIVVDERT
jgi:hypothetical protein